MSYFLVDVEPKCRDSTCFKTYLEKRRHPWIFSRLGAQYRADRTFYRSTIHVLQCFQRAMEQYLSQFRNNGRSDLRSNGRNRGENGLFTFCCLASCCLDSLPVRYDSTSITNERIRKEGIWKGFSLSVWDVKGYGSCDRARNSIWTL